MTADTQCHLNAVGRINLGSFYTPEKYVRLVGKWLSGRIDGTWVILDPSCGYGAFFQLQKQYPGNRYYGNDIDSDALRKAAEYFPFARLSCVNVLKDVSRSQYGIGEDEPLVIVGNPPYNDTTSQIAHGIKAQSSVDMDDSVRSRDLGISSLKAYARLKAEYVAILHPLSYLVKGANFSICRDFFGNYRIEEHVIFNSQEFAGTSRNNGFPVIVALYRRCPGKGMTYGDVEKMHWMTTEGNSFCIRNMEFVTDFVNKYPPKEGTADGSGYFFYTLRDINALKRSRTFVRNGNNAVPILKEQFDYYCYIDCFKRYATVPYYLGNLNVPFLKDGFQEIRQICRRVALHNHGDYFEKSEKVSPGDIQQVRKYIRDVMEKISTCECLREVKDSGRSKSS